MPILFMIQNSTAFYIEDTSVDLICVINVIETGRWKIWSYPCYIHIVSQLRFYFRNCKKNYYNKIHNLNKVLEYYLNNKILNHRSYETVPLSIYPLLMYVVNCFWLWNISFMATVISLLICYKFISSIQA